MKIMRGAALALAVLLLGLAGCSKDIWGSEKLLVAGEAEGTVYTDGDGTFSMTVPEGWYDATAKETDERAALTLACDREGYSASIQIVKRDYIQNFAVKTEETYAQDYKSLGMTLTSYARGKVLGENGLKLVGSFTMEGVGDMQYTQYAFNKAGCSYVFSCTSSVEDSRTLKKAFSSILGSFQVLESEKP